MDFSGLDNDSIALLITAAIMALGLALGGLLVGLSLRQMRVWARTLGDGLDVSFTLAGGRGKHGLHDYRFAVISRQHGASVLEVRLATPAPERLALSRETATHRTLMRHGLVGEAHAGIADFDSRYLIDAGHPGFVRDYLANARHRDAVDALFTLGFTRIDIGPEGFAARQDPWAGIARTPPRLVARSLPPLAELAADLPLVTPLPSGERRPESGGVTALWVAFALAVLGGALALHAGFAALPVDVWAALGPGLALALGGLILFARWAWTSVRGASDSHQRWLGAMLFALIGFPPLGWGLLATINAGFDGPAPPPRELLVLDKARRHVLGSRFDRIQVAAWGDRDAPVWFSVSPGLYRHAVPGTSRYALTLGPGALGFEWVREARLIPAPRP